MNSLKEIYEEVNDCSDLFYEKFCNINHCIECPFETKKHECFVARLDEIYLDLKTIINNAKKQIGV